ncbi:hypothetical protein [Acinetobacter phage vB_AbaP_HB01]|nr:hypothetical protein [Acinetobacter phage vB_AbaP_HB01]
MSFKMRKGTGNGGSGGNNGPKIDYAAINAQVDEGSHGCRIVHLIDLGDHQDSVRLGDKGYTGFLSENDAELFIEEMKEKHPNHPVFKNGAEPDIEEADDSDFDPKKTKTLKRTGKGDKAKWIESDAEPEYVVNINEYGGFKKDGTPLLYQEIALMADFTEMEIDYGEEIGIKPYRTLLNKTWMGDIQGFQLKKVPPAKDGGVWTIKGNTKLAEIVTACGFKDEILGVDLEEADFSLIVGAAFNQAIEKSGDNDQYVNNGKAIPLKKKKGVPEEVAELIDEPLIITFENATADLLEQAHIRYDVIKKIKTASNYEGSAMQEAVEEFEARNKAKFKAKSEEDDSNDDDDDDDDEGEKTQRKVTKEEKPKSTKTSKTRTKKAPEPEPEDDDGDNDDDGDDDDSDDWD